uniref:non-specific serine/threonine protein kinase n=1 Tax=Spermophilus dauricus TaxID=99837 RepID=A0A8C9ULA4_SPEDA
MNRGRSVTGQGLWAHLCFSVPRQDPFVESRIGGLQGNFGTVRLARHILTGAEVAVKTVGKGELDPAFLQAEVAIMKAVEHPSVVQLFQVVETADRVYLIMEYAGWGQLLQYIPEGVGLPEQEAQGLFEQVASALRACHAQGIAHRDVKAENILLDARGLVKLCDFGLGCQFRRGELLHTVCGTATYWAPELFLDQPYHGPAVDVWSLGVVLYLMLTGHLPFEGDTLEELRDQKRKKKTFLFFKKKNLLV